jgi:hypothetical protein
MAFMRNNNNGRRHNNHNNHNRHRHSNPNHQSSQTQQGGQRRNVNRINQVFESNGPEGRIRGTAQQIVEKYATMARDASSSDKVLSINYLQHAEHYQRLVNEILEEQGVYEREREQFRQQQGQQPDGSAENPAENFAPGFNQGDQPAAQQPQPPSQAPQQHQRQSAAQQHDDDNALPSFLHVPITSSENTAPEGPAPRRSQPRPRRANNPSNNDETAE